MANVQLRQSLRILFRGYRKLTPGMESQLQRLGFEVLRRKRHIVLQYWHGGKPFSFSISSTCSDRRAGLNIVAKIMRGI